MTAHLFQVGLEKFKVHKSKVGKVFLGAYCGPLVDPPAGGTPALPDFAPLMREVEGPGTTAQHPEPRCCGLIFSTALSIEKSSAPFVNKKTLTGRRKALLTYRRMKDGMHPARQFYRPEGLLEESHR
jgi:hypothetical protein